MKTFEGYRRANGTVGVRNHVIVINTVNELVGLTKKIAELVPGVLPVVHQGGLSQYPEDMKQTIRTLKGIAGHPNVSAVLLVAMGEDKIAYELMNALNKDRQNVASVYFNKDNSISDVFNKSKKWLEKAVERSRKEKKVTADVTELTIGLECGGSDAWSGITANPAIGVFSDSLVKDGGTSVLAETTEAIGAEHILARRAMNKKVGEEFLEIVRNYDERARVTGENIRAANPSPGNVAGGLTTLEEKSLGCIKKGGNSTLNEVIEYAEKPTQKGFVFMDTPGYDVESVAGLSAGGAQIVLFSTGKGSPTGSPIVPVVKIGTNPKLYKNMSEHIDVNAGEIIEGISTIEEIGEEIYKTVMRTANGSETASEKHKNHEFAIWRLAETI